MLELDPELVEIAVRDLGLDRDEIDRIAVGDARLTLATTPEDAFELVVGDAFGGQSVPWHLTTQEFLEALETHMSADGIYVMNLIDYQPASFARAEAATLREVFDDVVVMAPPDYFYGVRGGNFVLVAANMPLDAAAVQQTLAARGTTTLALAGADLNEWIDGARVLIDDYAPVDQLISPPPS